MGIKAGLVVRDERPEDYDAITDVTTRAFADPVYSTHTEQYMVLALRRAGALAISLVAELDGRVVGHVAFSPVQIEDGSTGWYALGPISVEPALQRQGIGSALIYEGFERLRSIGAAGCILVGSPRYYGQFGFCHFDQLTYAHAPAYALQALPFGDLVPEGEVIFHDAFDATAETVAVGS